jgi:hypothetical protein
MLTEMITRLNKTGGILKVDYDTEDNYLTVTLECCGYVASEKVHHGLEDYSGRADMLMDSLYDQIQVMKDYPDEPDVAPVVETSTKPTRKPKAKK